MRITLAQWRDKYGLPTMWADPTDEIPDCAGCQLRFIVGLDKPAINLCVFHSGFVDGFDAARDRA